MNDNANIKQFQLIKFINENCDDDHVISRMSIVLRRDKIEAPYYMITKIKLSTCIDRQENGLIHAMDILNHNRRHNLTEERYNEIKSLIDCNVLKCKAPGASASITAAFLRFSALANSHSEVIILALFSLSASACLPIVLCKSAGMMISLSSTESTSTPQESDFSSTIALIF